MNRLLLPHQQVPDCYQKIFLQQHLQIRILINNRNFKKLSCLFFLNFVNFSSITSQAHPEGVSVYPASKAAINQITEGMAQEFGRLGIRVNSIGPGTVMTEGTAGHYGDASAQAAIAGCLPIARMGQPDDIANAVSFFCSDEASWVTGQTLYVDGGHLAAHGAFFRWARKVPK